MIAQAIVVLLDFGAYLAPGLLLFGLWFALTPRTLVAMRILILLAAFVLMRDAMTPLRMWALGSEMQIAFSANPVVLATLGGLSLLLIAGLARVAPQLWALVVWYRGTRLTGLLMGLSLIHI